MAGVGPPPVPCLGVQPPSSLIFASGLSLFPYTYGGMGEMPPVVDPTAPGSRTFHVTANPGPVTDPTQAFVGFGLSFSIPPCIDASQFTAVRFTIAGNLGTCDLRVSLVTSEDNAVMYNPNGACVASMCYPPSSGPLTTGTSTVAFTDMVGGMPMPMVDPRSLNGIQWTLNLPTDPTVAPCVADFTVSEAAFVP